MENHLVILRPITEEHLPSYFNWINDKELVLYNSNYTPVSYEDHLKWYERIREQQDIRVFSIFEKKNHQLIGSCSLRNINLIHKNAEFQIRIGEHAYQNKGLGKEAIYLLVQYAFQELHLERVYLHVFSDNIRAIKAYQQCRFQIEGLMRKAACIDGMYKDVYVMGILKEDINF